MITPPNDLTHIYKGIYIIVIVCSITVIELWRECQDLDGVWSLECQR